MRRSFIEPNSRVQLERTERILDSDVPDRGRPALMRDCADCGIRDAMKLQNVAGTRRANVPLLYICDKCGTTMTIPPPHSPIPCG